MAEVYAQQNLIQVLCEHPDFEVFDPDNLENKKITENLYKRVELYEDEKINEITLQMYTLVIILFSVMAGIRKSKKSEK